jgi:hypothetical protein
MIRGSSLMFLKVGAQSRGISPYTATLEAPP